MAPPEPLSPDLLLEHAAFLRGLARSLVLDESRADDVVQEAYMAALRRPPPPRVRLRAWLAAVTRNLALRSRRTDRRV
jgi:DNA-directed RNA polymerase specialized sigma24 family protein